MSLIIRTAIKKTYLVIRLFVRTFYSIVRNRPYKLTLMITDGCNYQCGMCNIWKSKRQFMSLSEMKEMVVNFPGDLCWLNVSGGEISLNKSCEDFLIWASEANPGLLISFTTNGSAGISEKFSSYLSSQRRCLFYGLVSVDGFESVHDKIRGRHGAYNMAMASLDTLAKVHATNRLTQACVSFTLMQENIHCAVDFITSMLAGNYQVNINLVQNSEYYKKLDNQTLSSTKLAATEVLAKAELQQCLHKLIKLFFSFNYERLLRSLFLFIAYQRLSGSAFYFKCASIYSNILVHTDGVVKNCTILYTDTKFRFDSSISKQELIERFKQRNPELEKEIQSSKCESSCHTPCESYLHMHRSMIKTPLIFINKLIQLVFFNFFSLK